MPEDTVIFCVQRNDTGAIYIGISNNPPARCYRMQLVYNEAPLELLATFPGDLHEIRKQFHHLKDNNHWYKNTPELIDYINTHSVDLVDSGPDPQTLAEWINELDDIE